jgi:hypothetical protein
MIRIDLGCETSAGVFKYSVPRFGITGQSRQPLLDACRRLCAILGPAAGFRPFSTGRRTLSRRSCARSSLGPP